MENDSDDELIISEENRRTINSKEKVLVQSPQEKVNWTFRDMLCNDLKAMASGGDKYKKKDEKVDKGNIPTKRNRNAE